MHFLLNSHFGKHILLKNKEKYEALSKRISYCATQANSTARVSTNLHLLLYGTTLLKSAIYSGRAFSCSNDNANVA